MSETTFDVRVWGIHRYDGARATTYTLRWRVGAARFQRTFSTRKLAESFRADLSVAARDGLAFDLENGLPVSMQVREPARSWLAHCMAYVAVKWPRASARHRRSIAEALTDITLSVIDQPVGRPDEADFRRALYTWAFNLTARNHPPPDDLRLVIAWAERNSPHMDALSTARLRSVLDRLAVRQDGAPAAASTTARKRATLHNVLEYGVELEVFPSNPLKKVRWSTPRTLEEVDSRVVVNPEQARALIDAVWAYVPSVAAFFACMYYAGLRPAEARNLALPDCSLPSSGWGRLLLVGSHQTSGRAWTDSGSSGEQKSLKHRSARDTRPVPAHPELVACLRRHLDEFETGTGDRLFVTRTGRAGAPISPPYDKPVSMSTVYRAWQHARATALTEREAASLLARRPYDLRHACLSTWLNAGVPPAQVAEWAGHSVEVLLRVYAKCVIGDDQVALSRIEAALR